MALTVEEGAPIMVRSALWDPAGERLYAGIVKTIHPDDTLDAVVYPGDAGESDASLEVTGLTETTASATNRGWFRG